MRRDEVKKIKEEIKIDDLCEGLEAEFSWFLKYCRNL